MAEALTPDQVFIRKLTDIVLANLVNEKFDVYELAKASEHSIYRLSRRLHSILGKTIKQFIREVRLQKALEMLRDGTYTASEVAYKTGFSSPAYFNKCFHEFFGYPPGKVKSVDPNNRDAGILTQVSAESKLKKTRWRDYFLSLPGVLLLIVLLGVTGVFIFRNILKSEFVKSLLPSNGRVSIVVMPFRNLTNDTIWNVWQDAIQENIISSLSNNKELIVRQLETINPLLQSPDLTKYTSLTPAIADNVSKKLRANLFIYGSIQQSGPVIHVDAQLINTRTKEVLKAFKIEKPSKPEIIFQIIDTLSQSIKDFLIISRLIKENPYMQHLTTPTTYSEALRYYIYGRKAADNGERLTAISWYLKALAIDSNYFDPMIGLSSAYSKIDIEKDLQWVLRYYKKKDQWPIVPQLWASWAYAFNFEADVEGIKYLRQLQIIDDQEPKVPLFLGYHYIYLRQYDKAIQEFEKSLAIRRKLGREYLKNSWVFPSLGDAYHKTGQYSKERKLYREAEKYFKDNPNISDMKAILSLTEKHTTAAKRQIERYINLCKKNSYSEADITSGLGWIYSEAGNPDKAEGYYRKALSMEPENPDLMKSFADFLIDNNRKLNEVPELMDKAMALASNKFSYYDYSDTKGWSLYMQDRHQEALEILQKTWDSATFKVYYFYEHLEQARKAVAAD